MAKKVAPVGSTSMGAGMFSITVPIYYDNSGVNAAGNAANASLTATSQKVDEVGLKLRNLWAYGNQMVSIILNITRRAVQGTVAEATVQEALAIAALAQSEYAVGLTFYHAATAYALNRYIQGSILTAIAIAMQAGIVSAQINRIAAKVNREEAENLKHQIDAYRS